MLRSFTQSMELVTSDKSKLQIDCMNICMYDMNYRYPTPWHRQGTYVLIYVCQSMGVRTSYIHMYILHHSRMVNIEMDFF